MSKHTNPVFGVLDDDAHGYWSTTTKHGDLEVRTDLNIEGDIDIEQIRKFSDKLDDVAKFEALARTAMLTDADKKRSAVKTFRDRHAEFFDATESETCMTTTKKDIGAFLQRCELKRIALYPECPGHCMILDFGFRAAVTDYMLVVSFDDENRVVGVDMQR